MALERGSDDNLSCQLLRVDALPLENAEDLYQKLTELPFPPPLDPGMVIDGYRVEAELHASSRSQLYRVTDTESGQTLVMKTPSVNFDDDPAYIERFIMEPWIGRRIESPHVAKVIASERPASCLYYLQQYVEGRPLSAWIAEHPEPPIAEVIDIVEQIAKGLRAFHRRETLHQDLKPDNVMIDAEGHACIVDFGSCHAAGVHEISAPIERDRILGTASYAAPEYRLGEQGGVRSEIFSLAAIAYEMLTGALPYAEKFESASTPRHFEQLEYVPAYHHNPMVPVWMDGALRKALQIEPARRYGEISELLFDLRHPNTHFTRESPLPLIERDPVNFWRGVAALLLASQLATLWWLLN
jgi:serine/threonine protein kinase